MYKGFYNLTSAMLTHQHNLNVVGNNITNISTAGFKQDRYTASTFDDVMYVRIGNTLADGKTELGRQSYIRAASQLYTDFTQGTIEPTEIPLDLAIHGDGFFAVRGNNGQTIYTRCGNFSLDEEGYLCLQGVGRVMSDQMQDIRLQTDKIEGKVDGTIYAKANNTYLGRVGVFRFEDNGTLEHDELGYFTGNGAQPTDDVTLYWGCQERSNADMVKQMVEMITCERALQSAAQVSKMYDQLMTKATTEIAKQ